MKEKIVMVLMQPRDRVKEVLFERTCDLAQHLEDIASAEVLSREVSASGVARCVHVWRARANVPQILAPHLDAGLLEWVGLTEWRVDAYESRWVVEPRVKKGAVCEATVRLDTALGGRGTRIHVELDLLGLQAPAGFQALALRILSVHFRKLLEAAGRLAEG